MIRVDDKDRYNRSSALKKRIYLWGRRRRCGETTGGGERSNMKIVVSGAVLLS